MIIYNVTINVSDKIHEAWLPWMAKTHIPDMLATGKFIGARLCKVRMEEPTGGTTYAVQYTAATQDDLERYYAEDAEKMRQAGVTLFGEEMLAFRTELEVLGQTESE